METYLWPGVLAGLTLSLLAAVLLSWRWRSAMLRVQEAERAASKLAFAEAAAACACAERTARETQAHFLELLKCRKGYAIFTLDAAGRIQTWTPEAQAVYGYPEPEIRGRHVSMLYPPAEASAGAADLHLSNARTKGRMDDGGWRVRRDGKTFRVRVVLTAQRDAEGGDGGFWCLTEDLGGQGHGSSGAPRAEFAFDPAQDGARDVMAALAADGRITYLNRAFDKTTGMSRREWHGRPFTTLIHSGDWARVTELLKRLGQGQSPPTMEVRLLAASGRHVAVELTATPIMADGEPKGSLLLARTPTGWKATAETNAPGEEPVLRSQKLEALGRLAGGVAHDFNNLLTVILGYADLLSRYSADDHSREVGKEIQKAGERAAALTRQLLAFSRKQILQPTVLDVNSLVRDLDVMLRRLIGEDVQLTTALHAEALLVKVDRGQLEQALTNLVVNARDAMPKGGRLIISTAEVPASIETAAKGIRGYAMLTVTDSGCGMDEDVLKRLFEPFFTTKEVGKGTGLGLAMVYGIVQQSGGRIDVDSKLGRGTTFRVYLPLTDSALDVPKPAAADARSAGGHETILLVEDEEAVRQLACRTLQASGYNVLEACDGVSALTLCQRHLRAIDIIVTDVVMPGLGGVDLVHRIKVVRPQLKVLFMSGYTDSTVIRHGMEESEANYLQKPFTPDVLTRKVRDLLDQAAPRN